MHSYIKITVISTAILILSGCMATRSPLMNSAELSGQDFSNLASAKTGEACQKYLFGSIPIGKEKPSLKTAITNGGISNVMLAEYTARGGLFISKSCVTVYGM
jgi:hypothetical protein